MIFMSYSRNDFVELARSFIGYSEADGSFKDIIDIYNSYSPLPRNVKMQYNWEWCACFYSALAIELGYTDIIPIEISCYYMIEKAKEMGIWIEDDAYVPSPGDAILYDWGDTGYDDDTGVPDHIGCVEFVKDGYITVIEGNYSEAVKRRTIAINGRFIRGFITPEFNEEFVEDPNLISGLEIEQVAHEVIAGFWGNGAERVANLEAAGYNYCDVQAKVNYILNSEAVTAEDNDQNQPSSKLVSATTYADYFNEQVAGVYRTVTDLYCRNGAGTNQKALCVIPKDTDVRNYGFYSVVDGKKWLFLHVVLDGVTYEGFSSSLYLSRK